MAAPTLKRFTANSSATANTAVVVVPAVGATRALVISKIVVSNVSGNSAVVFSLLINGTAIAPAVNVPLLAGEVYGETGVVLVAGDTLQVQSTVASGVQVNVFGQEVDN